MTRKRRTRRDRHTGKAPVSRMHKARGIGLGLCFFTALAPVVFKALGDNDPPSSGVSAGHGPAAYSAQVLTSIISSMRSTSLLMPSAASLMRVASI